MSGLVAFTILVLLVMACVGLFLSGVSAMKQARIAKRMFKIRYAQAQVHESDPNE